MKNRAYSGADPIRLLLIGIAIVSGGLVVWVLLRYGIGILMPFLCAWILSLLLSPISEKISAATRIPKKAVSAAVLVSAIILLTLLAVLILNRILREVEALLLFWSEHPEQIGNAVQDMLGFFTGIGEKIPLLSALGEIEALKALIGDMGSLAEDLLRDTATRITSEIPELLLKLVKGMPSVLFFAVAFLISSFYFAVDGDRIHEGIRSLLPTMIRERVKGIRRRIATLLYRYLKVYVVLFLVTFTELFIGLSILGREYAFLIAIAVSALDILPLLGVGSVLLPWAGVLFLMHETKTAIGLLILWGIITVVRQILEPRLIGGSLGIHPLFALFSVYAGIRLFGFFGLFLGPAAAVLLKPLIRLLGEEREDPVPTDESC